MTLDAGDATIAEKPLATVAVTGRVVVAVATGAGITLLTALGARVFFGLGFGPLLSLAPIAAIAAGVTCHKVLDAALAAASGVIVGTLLAQAAYAHAWPLSTGWAQVMLTAAALAALEAAVVWWAVSRSARLGPLLAALAVGLVVLAGAMNSLAVASIPESPEWVTGRQGTAVPFTEALALRATQTDRTGDQVIFLDAIQRVSRGGGYYPSMVQALAEFDRTHPYIQDRLDLPTSYRQPALYVFFAILPDPGASWLLAGLVACAAAVGSAYVLARRFVGVPAALAGATAVMVYASATAATPGLLLTEFWAGLLALVAVTLFVRSATSRSLVGLQVTAAAFALAATLVRELAVTFLLAGLIAVLADRNLRGRRVWIAWTAALLAAAAAYLTHAREAMSAFRAANVPAGMSTQLASGWFHPDGRGLVGSVDVVAHALAWSPAAVWTALALCVAGALVVRADRGSRVLLALVGCVGVLLLAVVGPNGMTTVGEPLGYWGMIVLPSALACLPLAFSRIPGVAAPTAQPEPAAVRGDAE